MYESHLPDLRGNLILSCSRYPIMRTWDKTLSIADNIHAMTEDADAQGEDNCIAILYGRPQPPTTRLEPEQPDKPTPKPPDDDISHDGCTS